MKRIAAILIGVSSLAFAQSPRIVAHRGASHDAPENTLPSFKLAWEQGANAIEGDFHLTSDGHIICIHDYDTRRVTGKKISVKDSTFDALRKLDAGSWFDARFKGTPLPEFAEVAATVPASGQFYIEVKCGPEILPTLLGEIQKSGLKNDQVVIISFNAPVIRELKKTTSKFKAFWLSSFEKGNPLQPSSQQVLDTLADIHADGLSSKADPRVDAAFLKPLFQKNLGYHCWTVDDPKVAERFLELGAQSITTNRPGWLRQQLNAR
ncbi:glycerophosphoryl diester phosphodiesterase [Haloferula luteola]|uniref:Glycerophosphoryl diester phosphodiesterase n=1 Tax=Haloferula luteola TaxID=595692 RepID=A0A840V1X9_9BACT|nr:glycerophosphodiester phosphodiesterase [Haloferula luteola]MBB5351056.1 glycerophosphoryl diester phosphodiesterase [Haloferula luteola]